MHVNDPLVLKISNRDLIIKLGKSLNQWGKMFCKISKKDPLFYEYYQFLKLTNSFILVIFNRLKIYIML